MTVSASQLLPWIAFLPLIGAFLNGLFGRRFSRRVVFTIGVGTVAIAFLLSLRAFFALQAVAIEQPLDPALRYTAWTWVASGLFQFDVAFFLDPLSGLMLLIVTGVGLLIHIYSTGYMGDDASVHRYFAYLNLFMFSMLILILGKNLFMLFVGWEGVGVCSYLLIGFWFTDDQKAQAGQKAFVVNRIGDFGFIIGVALLLYHARGSTDYDVLKWLFGDGAYGPFYDPWTLGACCLLMFVGAAGKSAQLPLYVWLPDAMAGPTPVSALIHAATMVTAGVYMMCRLSFMYTLSPVVMGVIASVGAATALAAALMALTQRDIKKVLAYSTVSQLGFMVLAVGVGAFTAAVFHLMTHAFFKALLFLGSGSVIYAMHHEQDIFKMGGLKKKLPITRATFLIGTLAIAGVPFLSGFYSKDEILWGVHSNQQLIAVPERATAAWGDDQRVYIGGRNGIVLKREGDQWEEERVPLTQTNIRGVSQAVLPDIRALAGDGQGTWWAAGSFGSIYRSGGRGWTLAHSLDGDPTHFNAAAAAGPNAAWFVGDRGVVVHYDGTEFKKVDVGSRVSLTAVAARSETEVYVGGASGTLLKYDGKAWGKVPGVGSAAVTGFAKLGNDLYGVSEDGGLLKLGAAGFEKVAFTAPGVAKGLQLRGITANADGKLVLVGRAVLQGKEGENAVYIEGLPSTGFGVLAGPTSGLFRAVAHGLGTTYATGDDKAMYAPAAAESGVVLERVASVPTKPWFHHILWVVATFSALLTAFYMFRLYFLTFEGQTRATPEAYDHCHETPSHMWGPLVILAILSIGGGWFGHSLYQWLSPVFATANTRLLLDDHHTLMAYVPTLFGAFGIAIAAVWYGLNSPVPRQLAERFPTVYRVLYNKFYVDELYHLAIVKPFRATARVVHEIIDRIFVDGALVHGAASIWSVLGRALRPLQNGNVQNYAVGIAVGLAIIIWLVGMKPTLW
ncbi:MAG: NADH-quinone oxidoreductase subunit L [Myxococcales bacterium]|nr:NADH-quinone oxidoreductase subunit L [Myxococcales bacterium]